MQLNNTNGPIIFNWLHLTDLHMGIKDQHTLWPNVEEAFFDDLEFLVNER